MPFGAFSIAIIAREIGLSNFYFSLQKEIWYSVAEVPSASTVAVRFLPPRSKDKGDDADDCI